MTRKWTKRTLAQRIEKAQKELATQEAYHNRLAVKLAAKRQKIAKLQAKANPPVAAPAEVIPSA